MTMEFGITCVGNVTHTLAHFLRSGQLAHQQMKQGGGPARNIGSATSAADDPAVKDLVNCRVQAAFSQPEKGKDGGKKSPAKAGKTKSKITKRNKFDPSTPHAYVPPNEWKKMTAEQKEAARNARNNKGIKSRSVNTVTTVTDDEEVRHVSRLGSALEGDAVEGTDGADEVPDGSSPRQLLPVATVVPPHLLKAPPVKPLVTTQRLQAYKAGVKRKNKAVSFAQGSSKKQKVGGG